MCCPSTCCQRKRRAGKTRVLGNREGDCGFFISVGSCQCNAGDCPGALRREVSRTHWLRQAAAGWMELQPRRSLHGCCCHPRCTSTPLPFSNHPPLLPPSTRPAPTHSPVHGRPGLFVLQQVSHDLRRPLGSHQAPALGRHHLRETGGQEGRGGGLLAVKGRTAVWQSISTSHQAPPHLQRDGMGWDGYTPSPLITSTSTLPSPLPTSSCRQG